MAADAINRYGKTLDVKNCKNARFLGCAIALQLREVSGRAMAREPLSNSARHGHSDQSDVIGEGKLEIELYAGCREG